MSREAIVGRRPALEAIRANVAGELLVARSVRRTPAMRELLSAAGDSGLPVREVDEAAVEALAPGANHQGVAALVDMPQELGDADLAARRWPDHALVVVLDGVTDPQNFGAIARSAEAAGASAIVTRKRRGAPLTAAAVRASAGALLHLPVARVTNLTRAIGALQEAGFWAVGLAGEAPASLLEAEPPHGPLALVLGAEGEGLSRLVGEACDELVSIPMRGEIGSLNVAAAAAVALFQYALRRA